MTSDSSQTIGDFGLIVTGQEVEGLLEVHGQRDPHYPVNYLVVQKDSPADKAILAGATHATVKLLRNTHLYENPTQEISFNWQQLRDRTVEGDRVFYGENTPMISALVVKRKPLRHVETDNFPVPRPMKNDELETLGGKIATAFQRNPNSPAVQDFKRLYDEYLTLKLIVDLALEWNKDNHFEGTHLGKLLDQERERRA